MSKPEDKLMSMEEVLDVILSRASTVPGAALRKSREDRRRQTNPSVAKTKRRVERRRLSDVLVD